MEGGDTVGDKEIAMQILIKIMDSNTLNMEENPSDKSAVDLICETYSKILKAVRQG